MKYELNFPLIYNRSDNLKIVSQRLGFLDINNLFYEEFKRERNSEKNKFTNEVSVIILFKILSPFQKSNSPTAKNTSLYVKTRRDEKNINEMY